VTCYRLAVPRLTVVIIGMILFGVPACARPPQNVYWTKPGATQQTFAQDRYQCIQESKTPYSNTYVDPYTGGASSSGMRVDRGIFIACMEAKGWQADKQQR
jgi:hypothetical protein